MSKSDVYFVFDVESAGLHGEGFAVGYVVIDEGREVESGFFHAPHAHAKGLATDHAWVESNVVPSLKQDLFCTFSDGFGSKWPVEVRDAFWQRWEGWRDYGAVLAADVPWPVESRFLAACIDDVPSRSSPYPVIDVASVRLAAGFDPLSTEPRQEGEHPVHHPLADARQSARLLIDALAKARAGNWVESIS